MEQEAFEVNGERITVELMTPNHLHKVEQFVYEHFLQVVLVFHFADSTNILNAVFRLCAKTFYRYYRCL